MIEAAPPVIAGMCGQSSFHGIAMNLADRLVTSYLTMDIRVKITRSPELATIAS
jgi:hypothetical protein